MNPGPPPPSLPARFRLTPGERLLVACSWAPEGRLESLQAGQVAALCRAGIDWPAFLARVERHRLHALAHRNLARHGQAWVPPPVLADLADGAARERTLALRLGAECLRLVRRFNAAGLPVIPLAGALLSWQLYGDAALRPARRVEVRVREADLGPVLDLLSEEGYHPAVADGRPQPVPDPGALVAAGRERLRLWHRGRDITLEISWRWGGRTRAGAPAGWAGLRQETWLGVPVAVLAEADLLAGLCERGASRGWCRCRWLGDVAMVLAGDPAPDGAALAAAAQARGLARPVAQAALLVHWLYGVPLSPGLAQLVAAEPRARRLAAMALDRLRAPGPATLVQRLGHLAYAIQLHSPGHLARRLHHRLAQAPAWALDHLPTWMRWPFRSLGRPAEPR